MITTADLIMAAKWMGIATIGFAALATLAFLLKWSFRFRLVGVTGFMLVLTSGTFALGLGLYTTPNIAGASHYTTVYDTGADNVVIAVSPPITATELDATLRQAANKVFSYGRLNTGQGYMTVRARTIVHPKPGLSEPLVLGEVTRSLAQREDPQMKVQINQKNLARLPKVAT